MHCVPFSIVLLLTVLHETQCEHFADWTMLGGRPNEPTCVTIPTSMSLCADIGYDQMRLPNLLGHDTLAEVQQQSGSWVPLLNVRCHPYTKLFLCSLFTPVCLESQIFPCRSLCEEVQRGCEQRMGNYGYGWPEMLRCDKFPDDNDMCIKPMNNQTSLHQNEVSTCQACNPVETYENVLDNFCRADFVIRTRVKQQRKSKLKMKKVKIFKSTENKKGIRNAKLSLSGDNSCCDFKSGKTKYLIMGNRNEKGDLNPSFVMEWKKTKIIRDAVKVFKSLNCTDPNLFTPTADDGTIVPTATKIANKKQKSKHRKDRLNKRKRNKKNKRKNNKQKKRADRKKRIEKKRKDHHNEEAGTE